MTVIRGKFTLVVDGHTAVKCFYKLSGYLI